MYIVAPIFSIINGYCTGASRQTLTPPWLQDPPPPPLSTCAAVPALLAGELAACELRGVQIGLQAQQFQWSCCRETYTAQ